MPNQNSKKDQVIIYQHFIIDINIMSIIYNLFSFKYYFKNMQIIIPVTLSILALNKLEKFIYIKVITMPDTSIFLP